MKRRISPDALKADPHAIWNAFVDLLAMSSWEELNDFQRTPHLVFWYESEVQNGGHLQFFENRPDEQIDPTLEALRTLRADHYVPILSEAARRWRSRSRERLETVESHVSAALNGEFNDLDQAYYNAAPTIVDVLQNCLDRNVSEFIDLD